MGVVEGSWVGGTLGGREGKAKWADWFRKQEAKRADWRESERQGKAGRGGQRGAGKREVGPASRPDPGSVLRTLVN